MGAYFIEQSEKIFQWKDPRPDLIFPIDYTSKEIQREFGIEPRAFRDQVLRNALFMNILQELFPPNDKEDSRSEKGTMPPIPLEAVPFLKCFYQLAKQAEKEYHLDFFINSPNLTDDLQPFWLDLCKSLYDQTAPTGESKTQDFHAFCRHIFFQNDKFTSSLLYTLWEATIQPRCNDIIKLAKHVSLQEQVSALKICLMNLDSLCLTLQSQICIQSASEIRRRIYTSKGNQGLLAFKALHIANLCHKLWAEGFPYAKHPHNHREFRESGRKRKHLALDGR